jgi:hypothetical protein
VVSAAGCRLCSIAATIWGDSRAKGPEEALADALGLSDRCDRGAGPDPMHPGQGVGDGPAEHGID